MPLGTMLEPAQSPALKATAGVSNIVLSWFVRAPFAKALNDLLLRLRLIGRWQLARKFNRVD